MTPTCSKRSLSKPLTYLPAYLGLFSSLTLAAVCNSFLDIQYGTFGFESLFWALVFGLTLRIGWRQQGCIDDRGKRGQKMIIIIGVLLSVVIFIPKWGFPRAGLLILAMLQASLNCVTVSRRHLHLGLLVSAVMVMFAATHYRANWTMLFYLVPYVTAVVFTLVAEQINRRSEELKAQSLAPARVGGQGAAIFAGTASILLIGTLLYSLTPQLTWPQLQWGYGQLTNLGWLSKSGDIEFGNSSGGHEPGQRTGESDHSGDQGEFGQAQNAGGVGAKAEGDGGNKPYAVQPGKGWPSPSEMREAASQKGMPQWQRGAINRLADITEWTSISMEPLAQRLEELWQSIKNWFHEHSAEILQFLFALIVLGLLGAFWRLIREARIVLWLVAQLDYLWLVWLKQHGPGNVGAREYYLALQRLLDLRGIRRSPTENTREYLADVCDHFGHLRAEVTEITRLFEQARYGRGECSPKDLDRMRVLYHRIFQGYDQNTSTAG